MFTAAHSQKILEQCIGDYHKHDSVDHPISNPYNDSTIDYLLYLKCWVDTVQWHYEDLIRDPNIEPIEGMNLKRLIDKSNQHRTDLVEKIDDYFLAQFDKVQYNGNAKVNSESPAWVVDRLSILALKVYHMEEQVARTDVDSSHKSKSEGKLAILREQQVDLSKSFDELLVDIGNGDRKMKVYRQMKMYNDPTTNPVLYKGS